MAEDSSNVEKMASGIDDELSVLIGDYSIPHLTELSPDSMLTQSQYAKVIFHDIADTYPTDADICCRYSLTEGITPSHGDRIALYRVGWSSVQDYLQFEWAPGPPVIRNTDLQVLFKASSLPKDTTEFYQLCYVKSDNTVCGASVPFQFCHPHENDLCAVEEPGGMVVVRSRSAVADERMRQIVKTNEMLRNEIAELKIKIEDLQANILKKSEELKQAQTEINKLHTEKQDLEKKLEDRMHLERHVARLQNEMQALDADCNQNSAKLRKAEQHIEVLTATVDTLSVDKERMVQLLRAESENKVDAMAEARQYKGQVDSLNHMLEALTQSKEMVAQELRVQQANNTQLRNDIGCLEAEAHKDKELISALKKEKEEMQELLEQTLNAKSPANDPEKERLLAQVVNLTTTKDADIAKATKMLESRLQEESAKYQQLATEYERCYSEVKEKDKLLTELSQNNSCLKNQISDLRKSLDEKEKEIEEVKAKVSTNCGEDDVFRKVFADIQQRIAHLELEHEETTSARNIQKDRIVTIQLRLDELDLEIAAIKGEQGEVTVMYEDQEAELRRLKDKYSDLQARLNYMDDDSWTVEDPQVTEMKLELDEMQLFVESSRMRMVDLQLRLDELMQERQVIDQQLALAKERELRYKEQGAKLQAELVEVQTHEWEIIRENSVQMVTLMTQLDRALSEKSAQEVAWKTLSDQLVEVHKEKDLLMQELSKNDAQNSPQKQQDTASASRSAQEREQDLKLRLELAAVEYRKLYMEKQKLERRLTKLYHKLGEKKNAKKSSGASSLEIVDVSGAEAQGPETVPSMSLSQAAGFNTEPQIPPTQEKGGSNFCFICPICSVTFPPGAYDIFTQHFDSHLS